MGKSSLINALTRQWGVVRTSDKPGMTQVRVVVLEVEIGLFEVKLGVNMARSELNLDVWSWQSVNFFTLGTRLCLVDLPGYGFAYAKEAAKEAWDDLVSAFKYSSILSVYVLTRMCCAIYVSVRKWDFCENYLLVEYFAQVGQGVCYNKK